MSLFTLLWNKLMSFFSSRRRGTSIGGSTSSPADFLTTNIGNIVWGALQLTQQLSIHNKAGTDLTGTSTYTPVDNTVCSVSAGGLVTGLKNGNTTIHVVNGILSLDINVNIAQVVSTVTISPLTPSISVGTSQQFSVTAKDSNNQTITTFSGSWSSSDTIDLPIDNVSGLCNAINAGSAVIKFTAANGVFGTTTITSSLIATSIHIVPASFSAATGIVETFQVLDNLGTDRTAEIVSDVSSGAGIAQSQPDKPTVSNGTNASTSTLDIAVTCSAFGGIPATVFVEVDENGTNTWVAQTAVTWTGGLSSTQTVTATGLTSSKDYTNKIRATLANIVGNSYPSTPIGSGSTIAGTPVLNITSGSFTLINGGISVPTVTDGTSSVTGYSLIISDGTKGASVSTTGNPGVLGKAESGTFTVLARKTGYTDSVAITVTCSGGLINSVNPTGSSSTTDGTAVTITDKSPNATVYSVSTSKPTYKASKLNSKPAFQFTRSNSQYLQTTGNIAAQNPAIFASWFGVIYDTIGTAFERVFDNVDFTAKTGYRFGCSTVGVHLIEFGNGSALINAVASNSVTAGAFNVIGGYRDSSGFPHIRVNGTETVGGTSGTYVQNTTTAKTLGALNAANAHYLDGGTFAIQEYNRVPTTTEITQIENAIKYWGGTL